MQIKRPQHVADIMTGHSLCFVEIVRPGRNLFVVIPGEGPALPAPLSRAAFSIEKRIQIVVRHHLVLASAGVKGKCDEKYFVVKKTVPQMAIKRKHGRIVVHRVARTLLEINREEAEPLSVAF